MGKDLSCTKEDYIAQSLGISSRNVDNIIKEFEGEKNKKTGSENQRKEYNKDFAKKLKANTVLQQL